MKTKEVKIQIPEGYEVDKKNSTFECIKFKLIKKDITYRDVCNKLFGDIEKIYYYTDSCGDIQFCQTTNIEDENNATTVRQLKRILALNQLLNIAEYYNKQNPKQDLTQYYIVKNDKNGYDVVEYKWLQYILGVVALFNNKKDAQAVIDNPNFREILDTIYKQ